ncbi:MAG: hypothetical protein LBP27_01830 [Treponema sp.]|nr:hypothetical protein [Treponema sp.]
MKRLLMLLLVRTILPLYGEPLFSPAWGFKIDLPEGYEYTNGNGRDRFSFESPEGAQFDLAVYSGRSLKDLVDDTVKRLKNRGELSYFEYNGKNAALVELKFSNLEGWALCVELENREKAANSPLLLALSYGQAGNRNLDILHMSALDSVAPSGAERRYPGPVIEFGYPRGEAKKTALALPGLEAWIREHDAEAAQALVDREFAVLRRSLFAENWQEAWIRFYRAIYRDSWDRLRDAAFQLERNWNVPPVENRDLARKALEWVQGFRYERDLMGSDFVNLVSAVTEGRGDCDSRALLWAILLAQADVPAAIMVSREHSHAMGLADLPGAGARFEAGGTKWLVAETTAAVDIGLIGKDFSDTESWLGVVFGQEE